MRRGLATGVKGMVALACCDISLNALRAQHVKAAYPLFEFDRGENPSCILDNLCDNGISGRVLAADLFQPAVWKTECFKATTAHTEHFHRHANTARGGIFR